MRKLHAKVGTILTVLLCVVLVLGVLGVAGAAETSYVLKGNGSGYVANSTAITLGSDTVVVMKFGVDFIFEEDGKKAGLGDKEVGFGIVDASRVNNELVNSDNAEHGFAVVYGETTELLGGATENDTPQNKSLDTTKEKVMVEGKSYRVVYDNSIGEMFIESEATGTGTWYLVQHVTGIKKFDAGTRVYLGYFYRGNGVNMVLADVEYESYASTADISSVKLTKTDGISYEPGTKVTTLSTKGDAFIANKTPLTNNVKNDYVVSLSISDFTANDDVTIAFALTTGTPADGKIKSDDTGMRFKLTSKAGVSYEVDGSGGVGDAFINVTSVFTAGNKIKAVFSPDGGVFSLLIDTTGIFVEQFRMEGLDIPTTNVTYGMEISGEVNATFYGFEIYYPSNPSANGQDTTRLSQDDGIMTNGYGINCTYDENGVTLESKDVNGDSRTGIAISPDEFVVEEGQMLAILLDDLIEYDKTSARPYQIFSFSFIKDLSTDINDRQCWFGSNNSHFTMMYELTTGGDQRHVYDIRTSPADDGATGTLSDTTYRSVVTLGNGFSFDDIINEKHYGASFMACYDPYNLIYYLYKKTAVSPDYTCISTININGLSFQDKPQYKNKMIEDMKADEEDNTFHVGVKLTGGMTIKAKDLKAFVVDTDVVGVNEMHELTTTQDNPGSAELVTKGKNVYANTDGYIYTKEPMTIPNGGLAIEYDIENVSYLAGTYNIGWMITNDLSVITSGKEWAYNEKLDATITVQNNTKKEQEELTNESSKYSLLQFVSSNDLTPSFSDTMRDNLNDTGTSFRVIFYKDGTMKLQNKLLGAHEWNDIEYGIEETGTEEVPNTKIREYGDEPVWVGIRFQASYNLDITDEIKVYALTESTPYTGRISVKGGTLEMKPGTLRFSDVKVESVDDTRGSVKLTANENIDESKGDVLAGSVYMDSTVDLVATAEPGYAFEGWYVNGAKVSTSATYTVSVVNDVEYQANFVKATKVDVTNGTNKYEVATSGYYKNDDYIRIRPVSSVGYDFLGWNIRLLEVDIKKGTTITKESYELALNTSEDNMLSVTYDEHGKKTTNVWGTLSNDIVSGDSCTVTKEPFFNVISFGSFSVTDRAGYKDGDLLIKIPGLDCEYEYNPETQQDEMTVERKIVIEALYAKNDSVTNLRGETSYSEQHLKDMETTTMVGICFIALFVIGLAMLIALKKYVSYKKDIKALLEYEFVLKENDKL